MQNLRTRLSAKSKLKEVRDSKKWTVDSKEPLRRASKLLDPNWKYEENWYPGVSHESWKFFLYGMRSIKADIFKAYCQVLELEWEDIAEPNEIQETAQPVARTASATPSASNRNFVGREEAIANSRQDWGEAPDVSIFYGRTDELNQLRQWIEIDHCRLIALLGIGGIGKTTLSVKLAQQIARKFEYMIWCSLRHAPAIEDHLANLLSIFHQQPITNGSIKVNAQLSQVMEYLRSHRCFLVLDAYETVLSSGKPAGYYREGYQEYGQLLTRIGESKHQSCVLLTTWEKPKEIAALEGVSLPVRSLQLNGLGEAAKEILREKGLSEPEKWQELIKAYRGNPLALKIVATTIIDLFGGSVSEFLSKSLYLGDIEYLLYQQFNRLSELEKDLIYWLAINGSPVSLSQLQKNISSQVSISELLNLMESLGRRCLIEKNWENSDTMFALQPLLLRYVTKQYSQQ